MSETPVQAEGTQIVQPAVAQAKSARPAPDPAMRGTGRRKTAVARVRIKPGAGKFLIHDREINQYFFEVRDQFDVVAPLRVTNTLGRFDISVRVSGGGQTGQAQAIVLGLARALMKVDPSFEGVLRDNRFLTRDSRKVERKKPGQPGARKRFQFSKR